MFCKLLLVLTVCLYSSVEGQRFCEEGWEKFSDQFGAPLCILTVNESLPWLQAKTYCEKKVSHLLNLDRIDQFTKFQTRLGEHIFTMFRQFWSGLHLKKGRLMWDDFGPQFVLRSIWTYRPWIWEKGQPSSITGTVGKVNLGVANFTEIPNGDGELFNGQFTTSLSKDNLRLPFVCQKPGIYSIMKPLPNCEDGWIGNLFAPNCYSIVKEAVSQEDARARCKDVGASLATPELGFTSLVYTYYEQNDEVFQQYQTDNNGVWIDRSSDDPGLCYKYLTQEIRTPSRRKRGVPSSSIFLLEPCSTRLFFMCIKPTSYSIGADGHFKVDSPYFDQYELLSYSPFESIPVLALMGREYGENEVAFVKTPTGYINSTNNFLNVLNDQFSGYPKFNTLYDITASKQVINITLPSNSSRQLPSRRRRRNVDDDRVNEAKPYRLNKRGISDFPNKEILIDYNYIRYTTGYYSFGLYSRSPARYVETEPVLIRYAEPDMYIYVIKCNMTDRFVSEGGQLSREDITSFNMLQDPSYLSIIEEYAGAVMNNPPTQKDPAIRYYRVQIERVSNLTVQFRAFLSLANSRSWTVDMEQNMLAVVGNHWRTRLNTYAFNKDSLTIRSTVACPFRKFEYFDDNELANTATFASERVGNTGYSWERCYQGKGAIASSKCVGGYDNGVVWDSIEINRNCEMAPVLNESPSSADLKLLSEKDINDTNVEDILKITANLTRSEVNLTNADVIYTADILYNFLKLDNVRPDTLQQVYDIADNVLAAGSDVIDSAQSITNAANRLVLAIDDLTSALILNGNDLKRFVRPAIGSQVVQQSGYGALTIGIDLLQSDTSEIKNNSFVSVAMTENVFLNKTDTAIYIPANLITGVRSKLAFHIYSNTDLFTVINGRFKTNSKVAAARVYANDRPVFQLGDDRVTAVFKPYVLDDALVCAYWNYSARESAGSWNTEGCTTDIEGDRVVCKCNHLTNFAVLIDLQAHTISDTDKLILGIVTKVGLVLSIIGLGLTILTFLMFKHLRSGRGQQVLVNLSVSMLCSSIVFLVGMDRTENKAGCKIVAAILHYFILVSFMWMLVEGLLQYLRFVKVLGTYIPNFMKKSIIPAWGIPLIPVIVVLAIDHDLYYGGNGYCWMAHDAMLYAFIIPVAVIIAINIIVFLMVISKLLSRKKKGMISNQSDRKMAILHFRAALSIFVILGLTWIFGFLAVDGAKIVFHYLFAIFNALQGFFIFLLFTAREKQIRNAWKKLCCKESAYKSSSNSQPGKMSSANTHSTGVSSKNGGLSDGSFDNIALN